MRTLLSTAAFLTICMLAGCDRSDVKVYHVAKEETTVPSSPVPAVAMPAPSPDVAAQPQLHWTLPAGWTEKEPGQMRVASFTATDATGQVADIGVVPLPVNGQEIELVNMWREQLKLAPATNVDSEAVMIGGASGKLYSLVSEAALVDGKSPARIMVAELVRGDMSWFFKMTGADAVVAGQKDNFFAFLKSVSFDAVAPAPTLTMPTATASPGDSIWQVPPGWQVADAGPMLFAKFTVANGGAKADVNIMSISQAAGDGGGMLANVNRWRGQLGLSQLDDAGLAQIVTLSKAGSVVDLTGVNAKTSQPARLVGVVVSANGQTWFYKLMGDESVVAAQKDAFLQFIQSAKYPDAR
ncbi:MAG TPA: hypothetical protein VG347_07690 [Verrucomicrobiae bacterium]|nr:hypothetical protein [Verrucomicrobiae bacterium]